MVDADRGADELASRCVALVVFHEHARRTRPDRRAIDAEFLSVAREAAKGGISTIAIAAEVLSELDARFDPKKARRLHGEFLAGFDDDPAGVTARR